METSGWMRAASNGTSYERSLVSTCLVLSGGTPYICVCVVEMQDDDEYRTNGGVGEFLCEYTVLH